MALAVPALHKCGAADAGRTARQSASDSGLKGNRLNGMRASFGARPAHASGKNPQEVLVSRLREPKITADEIDGIAIVHEQLGARRTIGILWTVLMLRPSSKRVLRAALWGGLWLLVALPVGVAVQPPWQPQYKIRPNETSRLTAADVVGPDGLVYPDWRYAGVPGGIPDVKEVARIEDFGARADDGVDDSAAIDRAVAAAAKTGGGAVVFGKGTYHLDAPVVVTHDRIVLRGQGMRATRVVFRYMPRGVTFFRPRAGESLGPDKKGLSVLAWPHSPLSSWAAL